MKIPVNYSVLIVLLSIMAGCASPRMEREWRDYPVGKAYSPDNVYADEHLPRSLRRVAVLPFHYRQTVEGFTPEMQDLMIQSLRRKGRFEVITIDSDIMRERFGLPSMSVARAFDQEIAQWLKETYAVDGVLQCDITSFRAYKPMVVGLQGRLFTLNDNRLVWSCDETFDAGNKAVVMTARKYAEKELEQPYPLQSSFSVLLSPNRYVSFVAFTLFDTIPSAAVHTLP